MTTCIFDREIIDTTLYSAMKVSVCVHDTEAVQINIQPADACWPRITFFLNTIVAGELGAILTEAATVAKSSETTAD